jgi:hypothetical protein
MPAPSFADYCRLEPRLGRLAATIDALGPVEDPDACWYGPGGFKAQMNRFVGWFRTDDGPEVLFSTEAFNACYAALYDRLERRRAQPIKACKRGSADTR